MAQIGRKEIVVIAAVVALSAGVARARPVTPPAVLVVPQPFIVVPSAPAVRYAPEYPLDVFFYGGHYYAWQDGWFVTEQPGQPWVFVERERVPRPVLLVPAKYYKHVPPGHAKQHGKSQRHHPHQHQHDRDDDD